MNLHTALLLSCLSLASSSNLTNTLTNVVSGTSSGSKVDCTADKNNGFGKTECGTTTSGKKCCHPLRQKCVGPFKPKKAKIDSYVCSTNRALWGIKLVKVVFIPMFAMAFLLFALIFMICQFKSLENKKDGVKIMCILQVVFGFFVVCSEFWKLSIYTGFLAVCVFCFLREFASKYIVAGFITLQFFNVIAIFGAVDKANGVFIPLGLLAADSQASWEKGMIDKMIKTDGASCDKAFDSYFKLEGIEISREGADPEIKYFGFCTDDWLATVAVFVQVMGTVQFLMVVMTFGMIIPRLGGEIGRGCIPTVAEK